jgi:hypothetical protein
MWRGNKKEVCREGIERKWTSQEEATKSLRIIQVYAISRKYVKKTWKDCNVMDFIGPKFLTGKKEGINFLSLKYIRPEKYGIIQRVSGQTTNETIRVLTEICCF